MQWNLGMRTISFQGEPVTGRSISVPVMFPRGHPGSAHLGQIESTVVGVQYTKVWLLDVST